MADPALLALAGWSRSVSERLRCPSPESVPRFLGWLRRLGERTPGLALLPTSDEIAWLFARQADELKRVFRLAPLSPECALTILDKWRLRQACEAVGLGVLPTFCPESAADLPSLAAQASFPLVVKPRTQLFHGSHSKGAVVDDLPQLSAAWKSLAAVGCRDEDLLRREPGLQRPLLQPFVSDPRMGVISISGFADAAHEIVGARAASKVVLHPRMLSVGLRFRERPVDPALLDGLRRLVRRVFFHGVFEAEFLPWQGRLCLIDFNPRIYGQIGFDMARGFPLASMAYAEAIGDHAEVTRLARSVGPDLPDAEYLNAFALRADRIVSRLLREQVPEGVSPRAQGIRLAFVEDPRDPVPSLLDKLQLARSQLRRLARHLINRRRRLRPD